ncbi:MAG: MFS transporter [Sporolactobacillus sp.]|jgi:putative MFS transporter|nr:MFS transporter [Sporolactobacillus sp.]
MPAKKKRSEKRILGVAGLAWLFDAMDVGMISFIMVALGKDWQLDSAQLGWIGSIGSIGMAVGAFLFGMMADRIGRKKVLILTLLLFSIGAGLSALSAGLTMFLILRFVIGLGLGGELPVASTLVSESIAAEKRGRIVVLLESFWAVGWIAAALVSYFIIPDYGWRLALMIGALPAFYAIYLRWNIEDSATFQAHQADNTNFLSKMAEIWSKKYIRRTIMLWILWFCVVFSYYGMFLWLPGVVEAKGFGMVRSFLYVLIMTLAQLPGYFTAAWLIEKWGRKAVLVVYLLGTAISAYFFGMAESLAAVMTFGILLSFFNLGAWGAMYAYSPEQYPTVVRGTGTGMAAAFGRIGGIFGPLLVGDLLVRHVAVGSIFAIFCAAVVLAVLAVAFLGTETKARQLN